MVPYIDMMFEDVLTNNVAVTCFMTLANISVKHAEHFVKHTERCLQAWEENPYIVTSVTKTIANVGRLSKVGLLRNAREPTKSLVTVWTKLVTVLGRSKTLQVFLVTRPGTRHSD